MLNILAKQYYDSVYKEFEFYYQAALEECSFNSNTDKLNEFFVNSIIANYADNPHLAPWYKTALVYNTHLDLVTDVYSGNVDNIRIAAVNDTQILSPHNTTLAELESYRDKIRSFYERYYDPSEGELTSAMNTMQINQGNTLTFGGSSRHGGINSEDNYVSIITNLPEAVNIDYHAYAAASGGSVAIYPDVIDDIT